MVTKEQEMKQDRIVTGIREILKFREFDIKDVKEDKEVMDIVAEKQTADGDTVKLLTRFPKVGSLGVAVVRELEAYRKENDFDQAILVARKKVTHYARKESIKCGVEILSAANPLFNIFDHDLVPRHIILEKDEEEQVLEKYQVKKYQLPKILDSDPAVKAIQAKAGNVLRIERNPKLMEEGNYYRLVIKSQSRLRLKKKRKKSKSEEKDDEN